MGSERDGSETRPTSAADATGGDAERPTSEVEPPPPPAYEGYDEALAETFPASDPPAAAEPAPP